MRISKNWPRLVFIGIPLLVVSADSFVLISERFQTESQKAIRLVKESNSRKENFTVQQYLYTTVYHRVNRGESVTIDGWRTSNSDAGGLLVEFTYSDATGKHVAAWEADLNRGKVTPKNATAVELSWH